MNRKLFVFSLASLFLLSSLNLGIVNAGTNQNSNITPSIVPADILITFDDVADSTSLISAYPGVTFSADWLSWYTSSSYPAHSDPAVAYTNDFANSISFNPVRSVSLYVSSRSTEAIPLEGYNSLGVLVASTIIPADVNVYPANLWSDSGDITSIHFAYTAASNGQWVIDDLLLSAFVPVIDNLITFDKVPDLTNLASIYSGVTFSNDWESWVTSSPFTPSSAPNVAYSYDVNNFIQFDQAAKFVSVYVTNVFSLPIFLEGYDSLGNLISNATIPGNVEAFYVSVASDVANIDNIHFNYAPASSGQWIIDDLHWSVNLIPTVYSEWITFDTLPDSTTLETAYSGVTFSFDWLTWNSTSTSFTASSPHYVAYSYDFKNFIQFDQPARYVSVYVTNVGSEPIPVEALNSTGGIVAIANIPANNETYFVSLSSSGDNISSIHFDYPLANDGQWVIDDLSWGGSQPIGDNSGPTITGPVELLVELGDPSSQVAWQITDVSSGSFDIYQNGTLFMSNAWTDTIFQAGIALESYSQGTYEFRVDARDVHGNEATFLTIVYIRDTIAPVFTSFSDRLSYIHGDTGNILAWQVTDMDPETYVIYQTDPSGTESIVTNGIWFDFEQIVVRIDGLDPGEYVYRAEFTDGSGHTSTVETIVAVEPVSLPSEPTGNTSEPTDVTSDPPTTSDQTSTSENDSDTNSSDTPELPIPFSNIYVIIFSILGLTFIVRKRKN